MANWLLAALVLLHFYPISLYAYQMFISVIQLFFHAICCIYFRRVYIYTQGFEALCMCILNGKQDLKSHDGKKSRTEFRFLRNPATECDDRIRNLPMKFGTFTRKILECKLAFKQQKTEENKPFTKQIKSYVLDPKWFEVNEKFTKSSICEVGEITFKIAEVARWPELPY